MNVSSVCFFFNCPNELPTHQWCTCEQHNRWTLFPSPPADIVVSNWYTHSCGHVIRFSIQLVPKWQSMTCAIWVNDNNCACQWHLLNAERKHEGVGFLHPETGSLLFSFFVNGLKIIGNPPNVQRDVPIPFRYLKFVYDFFLISAVLQTRCRCDLWQYPK